MTVQPRNHRCSPYAHGLRYCSICDTWFAEHATTLIDAWAENCHGAPICPTCSKPLRSRPRKHTRQWRQQHLQEATQ